jgi:hypothetical protein
MRTHVKFLKGGMFLKCIVLVAFALLLGAHAAAGEDGQGKPKGNKKKRPDPVIPLEDPRGDPDVTICSQNLKMYGAYEAVKDRFKGYGLDDHKYRERELVQRFVNGGCDVIGVQEVVGRTTEVATKALEDLAERMRQVTNRTFDVRVGVPGDGGLAVGFLIAKDKATVVNSVAYAKVELPKLVPKQKPRIFSRSPLELQIVVESRETKISKTITLVNFHLKSKRGGADDPTGLEFETYRMEMSEALRRIVERRHRASFASGDQILVLLGDRNSHFDVASAKILEGTLALSSFQEDAPCRLSKRGVPLCKVGESLPQRLFSVLTTNPPLRSLPGTFTYKSEYSWIDDLLLPGESLPYAWQFAGREGVYNSGVVYKPKDATDHALVYVRLNW